MLAALAIGQAATSGEEEASSSSYCPSSDECSSDEHSSGQAEASSGTDESSMDPKPKSKSKAYRQRVSKARNGPSTHTVERASRATLSSKHSARGLRGRFVKAGAPLGKQNQGQHKHHSEDKSRRSRSRARKQHNRPPFRPDDGICFDDESGPDHSMAPILPYMNRGTSRAGAEPYLHKITSSKAPPPPEGHISPKERSAKPFYAGVRA